MAPPRLPSIQISAQFAADLEASLPPPPPPTYAASHRSSLGSLSVSFREHTRHTSRTSSRTVAGSFSADTISNDYDTVSVEGLDFRLELSTALKQIDLLSNNLQALHVLTDAIFQSGSPQLARSLAALTTESSERLRIIFKILRALGEKAESDRRRMQLAGALSLFKEALEAMRVGEWKELSRYEGRRRRLADKIRKNGPRNLNMSEGELNKLLEQAEEEGKAPVATLKLESFAGMWALERPFAELRSAISGADAYFLVLSTDYASKEFTRPKSWMARSSVRSRQKEARYRRKMMLLAAVLLCIVAVIVGVSVGAVVGSRT